MIFVSLPGQGPTVLIVPLRPPSGFLEVLDGQSIRIYTSLAGVLIICIEASLRSGANIVFEAVVGEASELGRIGEVLSAIMASEDLDLLTAVGDPLSDMVMIGEPLNDVVFFGELDRFAQVIEIEQQAKAGELDASAEIVQLKMSTRQGGIDALVQVC